MKYFLKLIFKKSSIFKTIYRSLICESKITSDNAMYFFELYFKTIRITICFEMINN